MIWIVRNNIFAHNKRLICSKKYVENSRTCWLPILSIGNIRTQRSGGQQTSAPLFFRFFGILLLSRCGNYPDAQEQFFMINPFDSEKTIQDRLRNGWHNITEVLKFGFWRILKAWGWSAICAIGSNQNGLLCFASATKAAAPTSVHDEWRSLATASFEYNSSKHLKAICFLSHFEISEIDWNPRGHHDC